MKVLLPALVLALAGFVTGCGSGGGASGPALTTAYLEAAPANLSPSPSDGQPISYGILNPTLVPIVQCPHNTSVPGIVICDFQSGQADTICIPWATLKNYSSDSSDYLGPCAN